MATVTMTVLVAATPAAGTLTVMAVPEVVLVAVPMAAGALALAGAENTISPLVTGFKLVSPAVALAVKVIVSDLE